MRNHHSVWPAITLVVALAGSPRAAVGVVEAPKDGQFDDAAIGVRGPRRFCRDLLGEPLISDYLAEGLDEFGLTWDDERTTPVSD